MKKTVTVKAGSTVRRAGTLLAAAALMAVAGCGGQTTDPNGNVGNEDSRPDSARKQTQEDSQADEAPGQVFAVSAKGDERVRLRYHPDQGAKRHIDLGVDIGLTTTLNGEKQPTLDMPRFVVHGDYRIVKVADDGSFTQELTLSEWTLDSEAESEGGLGAEERKALEQALESIGAMRSTTTLSPRGEVLDVAVDLPENAPAQVQSMLEEFKGQLANLQAPLPEEPVGVGSTWQSKNTLTLAEASFGKLDWDTAYRYRLKKIDGNRITIAVTYVQKAVPAELKDPDRPDTSGEITGGNVKGSGTIVVDLGLGAVTEGSLQADGTMDMTLKSGDQSGEVHYDLSYAFDIGGH